MLRVLRAVGLPLVLALMASCGTPDGAEDVEGDQVCAPVVANAGDTIPDPPDGAALCPPGICNYQTQEGCAEDQACQPDFTDDGAGVEATCLPAGERAPGETCNSQLRCQRGALCAEGVCRKLCCGRDWSACDEGESCFHTFSLQPPGQPPQNTGAWLCYPVGTCSVLRTDQCGPDKDCKMVDPRGSEACVPKSPGELHELCSSERVCGAGLTCVGQPGEATCRLLCSAEECGTPACPEEEGTCVHFNRNPRGVGECTPGW
jgi:hypothetical protein